jgi:hypothetical protein
MQVFSREWFFRHQRKLLFLLNNPFTKDWFRDKLGLRDSFFNDRRIVKIEVSSATVFEDIRDNKVFVTTVFYTRPFLSYALFKEFHLLWKVLHKTDEALLDKYFPEFSFGFDTLTVYPNAHVESTSVDGYASRGSGSGAGETFANIRANAGDGAGDSQGATVYMYIFASSTSGQYNLMARTITLFDTSSLADTTVISAATYSVKCNVSANTLSSPSCVACSCNPSSNTAIASGDYNIARWGSVDFGRAAMPSGGSTWSVGLNASGISNISKTGVSKFGIRYHWDIDNTAPAWASGAYARWQPFFADYGTYKPSLVITHALPASVPLFMNSYRRRRAFNV